MDPTVIFMVVVVFSPFAALLAIWAVNHRPARPTRRQVQEAVALLRLDRRFHRPMPVSGRVDGVNVELWESSAREARDDEGPAVEVEVEILDEVHVPLRISAEGLLPSLVRGTDTQTGEPRFDERIRLEAADPLPALALLDGATRDAVAHAVADGGWYDGTRWRMSITDVTWTGARMAQAVRTLIRAHKALDGAAARATPAGLAAVAEGDRHAGVRHRALALLIERGIASRSLLESRTSDVDAGIRYLAARALGADGVGTLQTIVRSGSRTWRVRAATALTAQALPIERAREAEDVLAGALDDLELADAALLGLGRIGTVRSVEPLKRVAAEGATADLRRAARDVLAQVRSRLDPARAGGLSLADTEQGGLSEVVPDEHGGLSLAADTEP